jgi:hypothetical protein
VVLASQEWKQLVREEHRNEKTRKQAMAWQVHWSLVSWSVGRACKEKRKVGLQLPDL